jgi:hypothetical protein
MQDLRHVRVTQMDQQVQAQAPVQVQVVEEAQVAAVQVTQTDR